MTTETGSVVDEGSAEVRPLPGRALRRPVQHHHLDPRRGPPGPTAGNGCGATSRGLDAGEITQLKTYHPQGDQSSARWFAGAGGWIHDQGGHCLRYASRQKLVDTTYAAKPVKPFVDGGPIYEDHPYCWKPEKGFSTADVRRDAYWAVLGGMAGHTSAHAVWQFSDGGRRGLGARGSWTDALKLPARRQMAHLRDLMTSLPFTRGRRTDRRSRRRPESGKDGS
ncbi:DUF4038 domain-containing protein [Pseudonocardia sp. MCCB 268]|nr:DUF4038 domain-containing protein [Pseudonocardia cytotoxica]